MMTNVMAGAYPDLFTAAAAYAGVPFGCFAGPTEWNSDCSSGLLIKTAEEWVRELFFPVLDLLETQYITG
jgi:acetylxylan esterase